MLSARVLPCPKRVRRVPSRFSWLDQRLVREGHLRGLSAWSGTLYLFLATVSDRFGMSWYSMRRICLETGMNADELGTARSELVKYELIAFSDGLYQVLEVPKLAEPRMSLQTSRGRAERAATREEVAAALSEFRGNCGRR